METNLKYRRALFWDINENDIETVLSESDEWVIPRVFEYGSLDDIRDVIKLYGREKTKNVLMQTHPLRPMTAAMAFLFLNVDPHKRYAA